MAAWFYLGSANVDFAQFTKEDRDRLLTPLSDSGVEIGPEKFQKEIWPVLLAGVAMQRKEQRRRSRGGDQDTHLLERIPTFFTRKDHNMASTQEWHYSRNGDQVGPVAAADLKRLASTGKLSPTDLIWKEGWEDWKQAGSIKGLFADVLPSKPVPPPLPETTDATASQTSGNVSDAVRSDLSDLMTTAKKAKDFAVAQTQKTQITQITLPKAYLALGKKLFDEGRFKEEFADLFQRISAINADIEKVKSCENERPQATDLKGKLQSGAASLLSQGQAAKLSLQRDSQLRALGKKAFELHGSEAGTPDVVSPIAAALDQLQNINTRIAESSSGKRVPLWQRTPVAAFLTICCFPVGLYLLWHNPRISRRTKLIWGGGFVCLMILGGIMTRIEIENAKAELAAGHQLWSSGDKPAAISKYRDVVNSSLRAIPESDRSLVLGRVIDFDAESGNTSSVETLLKLAEERHVVPSVSSEKARSIQEAWLADQRRLAQQKAEAERERIVKDTARQASPNPTRTQASEATLSRNDKPAENTYRFTLPKKRSYTDDDFQTLNLTGATPKQILDHFGKPDGVHKNSQYNDAGDIRSSKESWNYYNLVRHSVTGKRLALHIYFRNADGKVVTHELQ